MLTIQSFVNDPVTSNCHVIFDRETGKDCIVVDPGSRYEDKLTAFMREKGLTPRYIILTHEHFDHCWGVNQLVDLYHIPVICSQLCADAIKEEKRNCSVFYDNKAGFTIHCETIDAERMDRALEFAGQGIRFFKTAGHTDAGVSLVIGQCLFTGDTLIKDVRTVTKLPTGSVEKLKVSMLLYAEMQNRGYRVYPGHGEEFELDGYDLNRMLL